MQILALNIPMSLVSDVLSSVAHLAGLIFSFKRGHLIFCRITRASSTSVSLAELSSRTPSSRPPTNTWWTTSSSSSSPTSAGQTQSLDECFMAGDDFRLPWAFGIVYLSYAQTLKYVLIKSSWVSSNITYLATAV